MGLDISVYTKVELTPEHPLMEACYEADPYHIYTGKDTFPQSHRGLVPNRCYASLGESWGFHGGSYSGYNRFREVLCQAAYGLAIDPHYVWGNLDAFRDKPFFELIDFSDCEGCIGPEACIDLAKDFDDWPAVGTFMAEQDWGYHYGEWNRAFHEAAGSGLVDFH